MDGYVATKSGICFGAPGCEEGFCDVIVRGGAPVATFRAALTFVAMKVVYMSWRAVRVSGWEL